MEQLPLPQVGVKTLRLRVPVLSQVLEKPPQALQGPKVTVPQDVPFVERVQLRDSLVVTVPQLPLLHVGVITLRLWVPVVSQVLAKPPQAPHAPKVTLPQDVPFVERVQLRDSLVVTVPQLPPLHVGVITLRLCVPVVSQLLENPPQAPHAPKVTPPQDVPFVERVQLRDSLVVTVEQPPPLHVGVITLRLWVPVVSQVLAKPPHAPHAPKVTLPQELPFVLREHVPVSVDIVLSQLPPLQSGVVTVRVREPVSSQVPLNPPQALHDPVDTLPQEPPSVPRMHERDSEELCEVHEPD